VSDQTSRQLSGRRRQLHYSRKPETRTKRAETTTQKPTARECEGQAERKEHHMLYTIAVVLIVLWLLGLVTSYTLSGFIHILLVIAVVMILVNIIQGRRPL